MKNTGASKGYAPTYVKMMLSDSKYARRPRWYPLAGTFLLGICCGIFLSWHRAPADQFSGGAHTDGQVESGMKVLDDALFLGPQRGDERPARLAE